MAHALGAVDPSRIIPDNGAATALWEMTWNKGENSLLTAHTPPRDPEDRRAPSEVRVWDKVWALSMPSRVHALFKDSYVESVLIRREYAIVLKDAITWASKRSPTTFDSGDRTDDDDEPLVEIKNPFSEPEASRAIVPRKMLWLYYILVFRLAVGLPTIFVNDSNHLYIFNHSGAFVFTDYESPFETSAGERFKECITRDYWCLVDSSARFIGVPEFIMEQNRFVVQAASPRIEHTKWTRKTPYQFFTYFMKPWTLSELIAGREFQKASVLPSEAELAAYYARHVPSARIAYRHAQAQSMPLFEDKIREDLRDLSFETFKSLLTTLSTMRVGNQEVSHKYILIAPMPGDRATFTTDVPSRYIFELIHNALDISTHHQAAGLYNFLAKFPQTRATAGYLLEHYFHQIIIKGGEWEVRSLAHTDTGPKNVVWSATDDRPSVPAIEYLHLGCISPLRSFILVSDNPLENMAYRSFEVRVFDPYDRQLQLDDGYYYRPNPDFPATFDGFVYTSHTQTATLFQATVSPDHSMSLRGIKWLQELGVIKFDYIIVTPPGPIQVPIPIAVNQCFDKKYQIIVKSLDLGPDLPFQPGV
ncbi:hypothetical protein BOTBODRAFT_177780 [Botryobasidium botryosum FD-172 SS1]|uniref:Uncharacterized protein n=1 Tax=Botryobasidium botryosum (strain FD-172 SS1) TaxID=930990 RepID=A0A067MH77_BOTB1|nr:hypothetical protein BOTBODRAFT_177780 [Botryobasidium botryosum FD-172 SS1]